MLRNIITSDPKLCMIFYGASNSGAIQKLFDCILEDFWPPVYCIDILLLMPWCKGIFSQGEGVTCAFVNPQKYRLLVQPILIFICLEPLAKRWLTTAHGVPSPTLAQICFCLGIHKANPSFPSLCCKIYKQCFSNHFDRKISIEFYI
jgi:hypothetical protein